MDERHIGAGKVVDERADEFMLAPEVAKRLHVCPHTLIEWGRAGKLPFIKLNRKTLWHWPSVKEALLKMQHENGGAT